MSEENLGSFKFLYTFVEVAMIYKLDTSTLRKQIARGELKDGEEVKKFGGTWLMTEQAMIKHFGAGALDYYKTNNKATDWQIRPTIAKPKVQFEEEDDDMFMI